MSLSWTRASIKLPPECTPVLVTYISLIDRKPLSDLIARYENGKWIDHSDNEPVWADITHWMELPRPFGRRC